MSGERSSRFAVVFARETARSSSARLCSACVEVLSVTGAGITIMGGDQAGPLCVSDPSYTAEPGSASDERLQLLGSWAASNEANNAAANDAPGNITTEDA